MMNPKQLRESVNGALVLLHAMQDPDTLTSITKELDDKLKSIDAKLEEIKGLSGIVATLAEAEEIRNGANKLRETALASAKEVKEMARTELENARDKADDLIMKAQEDRDEAKRLRGEASDALDERILEEKTLKENNTKRASQLSRAETALEEQKEDMRKKVEQAQNIDWT